MPFRRAGKRGQRDRIGRNVDQLVAFGIIEMMVVFGVGVEHTVFIMHSNAPQQSDLGELVQRVVDGATCHMRAGITNFAGQTVGGDMAVTAIKQQLGNQQSLTRRPQPRITTRSANAAGFSAASSAQAEADDER